MLWRKACASRAVTYTDSRHVSNKGHVSPHNRRRHAHLRAMLAALLDRAVETRERLMEMSAPLVDRLAPGFALVQQTWALAQPYAVKAFHYGFIPFVLLLGMNSQPKPKLLDLLTPM